MSDTHSLTSHIRLQIPDGDVFVHAGDFTRTGALEQVKEFNSWIAKVVEYHICIYRIIKLFIHFCSIL